MALVFNPLSGEMEDDGTGQPDTAAPPPQPTGLEPALPGQATFAEGAGAAPVAAPSAPALPVAPAPQRPAAAPAAPAPLAVPVLSAKPEWEQHRRVESAKDKDATAKLEQSRAKQEEAADKADAAKQAEAETKAEDARVRRLMEERRQIQFQLAESEKKQKIAEHMAADKAAIEASAKDEAIKNSAGNLTGTAKVFATIMTALGDAGQTLAALGSRGTAAFQDANPVAEFYEKERQKRIAAAKADFDKNERVRALRKAGRADELKVLEDRLTIGINNEFQRDMAAQEATLNARLARLGLNSQKAGAEMAKAGRAVVNATVDRENDQLYDSTVTNRSPTGGGTAAVLDAQRGVRDVPDVDGTIIGQAPTKEEAEKLRAKKALVTSITGQLEGIKDLVGETGVVERLPGVGQFTEKQQKIAGKIDTILPQITQFLGSGTPQEAEARRKLQTLSVSATQGKKISQANVDDAVNYFINSYKDAAQAAVPAGKVADTPSSRSTLRAQVEERMGVSGKKSAAEPAEVKTYRDKDGNTFRGRKLANGDIERVD